MPMRDKVVSAAEAVAIEPAQTFPGGNPQVPSAILMDGDHVALGQPFGDIIAAEGHTLRPGQVHGQQGAGEAAGGGQTAHGPPAYTIPGSPSHIHAMEPLSPRP